MTCKKWFVWVLTLVLMFGICTTTLGESALPDDAQELSNLNDGLAAALQTLAEQAKDPWEKAIYAAGAKDVTRDGKKVHFLLRSFAPGLKSMPDYAADAEEWREVFFARVSEYSLEVSLEISGDTLSSAAIKKLKGIVSKAAKAAKAEFDKKAVRVALMDLLFEEDDSADLAPLLAAQSKQSLSAKNGPHALELTFTGANPELMLEDARKSVTDQFSTMYKANAMDEVEIVEAFEKALAQKAAAISKKGGKAYAFTLDIDGVSAGSFGEAYETYVQSYDTALARWQLIDDVRMMPDAPAQAFPQSARISGGQSGTKVTLKAPKDELGRYVQVRKSITDEMAADMFIRPGGSVTVYIPQGAYYLLIASGKTWYGMEELFGNSGSYSETAETEILSKEYYHTITLESTSEGDVYVYDSSPSAFQK